MEALKVSLHQELTIRIQDMTCTRRRLEQLRSYENNNCSLHQMHLEVSFELGRVIPSIYSCHLANKIPIIFASY